MVHDTDQDILIPRLEFKVSVGTFVFVQHISGGSDEELVRRSDS